MYGLLDDGLDVEQLQLDNKLHMALEFIKFPQPVTTMAPTLLFSFTQALM
jgi:hypothetical protein